MLYRSALTPQGAELASIRYRSNAAPDARKKVSFVREDAKRPYYYVDLSVVPSPKEEGQQVRVPVEKSIKLGDAGTVACFAIKRLGVDVRITLRSDDPAFLNVVGAAVEAELNRALGAK